MIYSLATLNRCLLVTGSQQWLSIRAVTFTADYIQYLLLGARPDASLPYMTVKGVGNWDLSDGEARVEAAVAFTCLGWYLQTHATDYYTAFGAVKRQHLSCQE